MLKPDIISVIEREGLEPKRRGRDFWACCPFHDEQTPSFKVSSEKQKWYCFGCGAHGDVIDFVQRIKGCDFKAALRILGMKDNPLPIDPKVKKQKSLLQAFKTWRDDYFFRLSDELLHLRFIKECFQKFPAVSESLAWEYAEKIGRINLINYKLDLLAAGDKETVFDLFLEDTGQ